MGSIIELGGRGSHILILPGFTFHKEKYIPLARELSNKHRVIIADLPGVGNVPMHRSFRLKDYADYVEGLITKHHLISPVLVGHSLGGSISILLASEKPSKIKEIVLVDSGGMRQRSFADTIFSYLYTLRLDCLKDFLGESLNWKDPLTGWYFLRHIIENGPTPNLESLLPKVSARSLVVWGEKDRTFPVALGRLMSARLPRSRFVMLHGATHGAPFEQPERLAQEIEAFLTSVLN